MLTPLESAALAWDASGQMTEAALYAGTAEFTYDPDGRRVAKQSTDGAVTGFLYDASRLLHETDEVGGDVTRTYASDTNDEFGDLIGEDGEMAHAYDARANTDALLDPAGAIEARYKYDAFGQVAAVNVGDLGWSTLTADQWAALSADGWSSMGADEWAGLPPELTTHMLAGGKKQYYLDNETALYLLGGGNSASGGRYYDAATARFTSEDPERHSGGNAAGGDGPSLYAYVANDPVNNLDPSGHERRKDQIDRKK